MLVNMFWVKAHFYSSIMYKKSTGINHYDTSTVSNLIKHI